MRFRDTALLTTYGKRRSAVTRALAPVAGTWAAWWTTYDPSLPLDPGLSIVSGEVDAWTDRRRGYVLAATAAANRPLYAADGTHFGGRKAVQVSKTGPRYLRLLSPSPTIFPVGTPNPWAIVVYRFVAAPSAANEMVVRVLSVSQSMNTLAIVGKPTSTRGVVLQTGTVTFTTDLNPHVHSGGSAGGTATQAIDGGGDFAGTAGSMTEDSGSISVGAGNTGTLPTEASIVEIFLFTERPPAAVESALVSALKSKWQLPSTSRDILGAKLKIHCDGNQVGLGIGTRIATWIDQTGNGNHATQPTMATQPNQALAAIDAVAAARYVDGQILTFGVLNGLAIGDHMDLFIVTKQGAATGVFGYTLAFPFNSATWMDLQRNGTAPSKNFDHSNRRLTFNDASDDVYELLRLRTTPTLSVDRNGVQIATSAFTEGLLGASLSGGYLGTHFVGDIAEFLMLNAPPSASELTALMQWFQARYPSLSLTIP